MDNLTIDQRRKNMQRIRSIDSSAELIIKEILENNHYKYVHIDSTLPGKPDFVLKDKQIVIFVDSDFWHCHPKRCIFPKSNLCYWSKKLLRNYKRDEFVNRELKKLGWKVIRLWEYDIKKAQSTCETLLNQTIKKKSIKKPEYIFLEGRNKREIGRIYFFMRIILYRIKSL